MYIHMYVCMFERNISRRNFSLKKKLEKNFEILACTQAHEPVCVCVYVYNECKFVYVCEGFINRTIIVRYSIFHKLHGVAVGFDSSSVN